MRAEREGARKTRRPMKRTSVTAGQKREPISMKSLPEKERRNHLLVRICVLYFRWKKPDFCFHPDFLYVCVSGHDFPLPRFLSRVCCFCLPSFDLSSPVVSIMSVHDPLTPSSCARYLSHTCQSINETSQRSKLFPASCFSSSFSSFGTQIDTEKMFSNIFLIYEANDSFWVNHLLPMLETARRTSSPMDPSLAMDGFVKVNKKKLHIIILSIAKASLSETETKITRRWRCSCS